MSAPIWTVAEVARALGAAGSFPDTPIDFVTQDSRLVKPGSLFVALSGTPSGGFISAFASARDGWEFADKAEASGAVAMIVPHEIAGVRIPQIVVKDTLIDGLWGLARAARARFKGPVIGLTGSEPDAVLAALEHLEGAKGRLERVGEHNGAPIFVDYAHKPDALAKALQALRPYAKRRLVVIFGAGGDRDAGKRPIMGAIAAENADEVIVTDDNPRSENPQNIRAAILAEAKGATVIGDRAEAIRAGIAALQPGDALLIAGKGHETGQIVGDKVLPFSDHEAVAAALAARVA